VSWADASGVLSAIEVATKASKVANKKALIVLFMELKSFMQLIDRKIKITKINNRSNPEMLSFSQSFKSPSHSKNNNSCHETVTE
jgi:hypothetical protein